MLELHDVHAHYGAAQALRGVSLEVHEGQIACILGRNGAGKSTTLKTVMGLISPEKGTILLRGNRIDRQAPHRIASLGVAWVPEDRRVFASLSVEENIRAAAQAVRRGNPKRRVSEVFELFPQLVALGKDLAKTLSGGQQQMLAIARALACSPDMLLLDEPTEGLAPNAVKAIHDIVLKTKALGLSMLLVEQNLRFALAVGDVFFILTRGTVAFRGTRAELLSTDVIGRHLGLGAAASRAS